MDYRRGCLLTYEMTHNMKLKPSPFEMIKSGQKTIELRLYDEKRRLVNVGDMIVFTNNKSGEALSAKVINLHRFDSFESMYKSLPLTKCGYTKENFALASADDMLSYYSKEEQAMYGVVGIEIELI